MAIEIRKHHSPKGPWIISGLLGLVLIFVSVPGLISQIYARPAASIIDVAQAGASSVPSVHLDHALDDLDNALRFAPVPGKLWAQKASLLLHRLKTEAQEKETELDQKLLGRARQALVRALKSGPVDADLWYRLALIGAISGKDSAQGEDYLTMSYLTGPFDGSVVVDRLALSLQMNPYRSPDLQRYVRREIRSMWRSEPFKPSLVSVFMSAPQAGQRLVIEEIANMSPEAVAGFRSEAIKQGWTESVEPLGQP